MPGQCFMGIERFTIGRIHRRRIGADEHDALRPHPVDGSREERDQKGVPARIGYLAMPGFEQEPRRPLPVVLGDEFGGDGFCVFGVDYEAGTDKLQ